MFDTVLKFETFFLFIVLFEALSCSCPFVDVERRHGLSAMKEKEQSISNLSRRWNMKGDPFLVRFVLVLFCYRRTRPVIPIISRFFYLCDVLNLACR